jgi:serine/tyrosine/threonine adenylyltransferase
MFQNIQPSSTFSTLPKILWEEVPPTPLTQPKLAAVSKSCASLIGLGDYKANEFLSWLNGETRITGDQRISTRYAGHQFGHWAGQLGDGRAISILEFLHQNKRWEIQTKGSGLTPFSRMGDGKAVIRSSVREFLCSEAMNGLGIPSSRALALIVGEDSVYRETIEKSAIVARVFPTNLRFGHFEYCYHFKEKDALSKLIHYTRENFYPNCRSIEEMFLEITKRTAELIALWMGVGFSHGVMNSDNMSILGITIDYGPFGFMEKTQMDYICNHSDDRGRYSFQNQAPVALWNLERLAVCFVDFVEREKLVEILQSFPNLFRDYWLKIFRAKIGIKTPHEKDEDLIKSLLEAMQEDGVDYTYFFRTLSIANTKASFESYFPRSLSLQKWFSLYLERMQLETSTPSERENLMQKNNPKVVLKNYLAQEIISATEKGDFSLLEKWLNIFENPYLEHPGIEIYSGPTPENVGHCEVSCSS